MADAVQAHAETYAGLVEVGVGVVPGWGGCARLLARYATDPKRPNGPMAPVAQAFEQIGLAKVAKSAFEAIETGILRPSDRVTFNRDRLLADAKVLAIELAEGYRPPEPAELRLPGPSGAAALGLALHDLDLKGQLTPHDKTVTGRTRGRADRRRHRPDVERQRDGAARPRTRRLHAADPDRGHAGPRRAHARHR